MNDPATTEFPDLRPLLTRAQHWVTGLIAGVTQDQLADPTPCEDLDVRALIGHLYTGSRRVEVMAKGGDARTIPFITDLPEDDLAAGYREHAEASRRAWAAADLGTPVTAPWGTIPGALAIGGYLQEAVTHGWDLAVSTGQPSEADPELSEAALAAAHRALPGRAEGRWHPVRAGRRARAVRHTDPTPGELDRSAHDLVPQPDPRALITGQHCAVMGWPVMGWAMGRAVTAVHTRHVVNAAP